MFTLRFDMRALESGAPTAELYAAGFPGHRVALSETGRRGRVAGRHAYGGQRTQRHAERPAIDQGSMT
jgi:hypothetical protein